MGLVLWKGKPVKKLNLAWLVSLATDKAGHKTVRRSRRSCKSKFRMIVRYSTLLVDIPAIVVRFEYCSYLNGIFVLLRFFNGFFSYSLAPIGSRVGSIFYPSNYFDNKLVNSSFLGSFFHIVDGELGIFAFNLSGIKSKNSCFARSGGCYVQILAKSSFGILVKLPSGKFKVFPDNSTAQVGIPSLCLRSSYNTFLGKAGRNRWLGNRPKVRGVAMNPVDHPHGGGEGRSSGGRNPVSPWGFLTKGKKTRKIDTAKYYKLLRKFS